MKKVLYLVLAFAAMFAFVACDDDDDNNDAPLAPPSLTLSSATGSNIPGATVGTTVTLNAPAGLRSLTILKNGAPSADFPVVNYSGETSSAYDFTYTVEELNAGSEVNFTFIIEDTEQRTRQGFFAVTVSDLPPKTTVQVGGTSQRPEFDEFIPVTTVQGVEGGFINTDVTFSADKIYTLFSFVRIGPATNPATDNGQSEGVLTIEPGTIIFGDTETKGTLVIQRGGKIFAEGTPEMPIVFTSEKAPGLRVPGDWGGVVMCGRASNNQGSGAAFGNIQLEGGYGGWHGGTENNDNSGILRYVRIEFAGIPINPNEEVNTLTMGSLGKSTIIEYVQASYGLDDQFEWFGGNVDGRYLICYRGLDDDFDVDLGYNGNVQFGLGIRDSKAADQSGSNGFEVDNDGASSLSEPFTSGVFSNITIIGPKKVRETSIAAEFQHGAQLRRSSRLRIYNSIITGYPHGLYIDGANTAAGAEADQLQVRNTIVAGVSGWGNNGFGSAELPGIAVPGLPFKDGNGNDRGRHPGSEPRGLNLRNNTQSFDIEGWFSTPAYRNQLVAAWDQTGLNGSYFDLGTPSLTIPSNSLLADYARWNNTPFADSNSKSAWFGDFEKVNFAGAFGVNNDWTEGWAEWQPQLKEYK